MFRNASHRHFAQPRRQAMRTSMPLLCVAVIALLSGCAGTRGAAPYPSGPLPVPARASDALAYGAAKHSLADPASATWTVRGEEVDVTLLAPAERGPFPLLVYLPGLGESSAAGSAWRRAWAAAGYVVLSAQSRSNGPDAWRGERARSFDFRTVALEHFSPRTIPERLATIQGVIDEAFRRQRTSGNRGEGVEARIDPARIAIAGYDVGALSAMVVAGQNVSDQPGPTPLPAIRAVIALSPYADFAGMGTEARFRDVRLPVLSVTSPEDTDAYGLVTSAAVRRAPFQYMPPGRKYLLLLAAGPHSLLGGQEHPSTDREDNRAGVRTGGAMADRGTSREGRSARNRGDASGAGSATPVISRPDPGASWATQLRNVQAVSTAFLDATVKDEGRAADWLARDAQRWLEGSATLIAK